MTYFLLDVHLQFNYSAFTSSSLHFNSAFTSFWPTSFLFTCFTPLTITFLLINLNDFWFFSFLRIDRLFFEMLLFFLFILFLTSSLSLVFILDSTALAIFSFFFILLWPLSHSLAMLIKRAICLRLIIYIHVAD